MRMQRVVYIVHCTLHIAHRSKAQSGANLFWLRFKPSLTPLVELFWLSHPLSSSRCRRRMKPPFCLFRLGLRSAGTFSWTPDLVNGIMFVNGHAGNTPHFIRTVLSIKTHRPFRIGLLDWIFNLAKVQAVLRQTNKMFRLSRLLNVLQSFLRFAHVSDSMNIEYCSKMFSLILISVSKTLERCCLHVSGALCIIGERCNLSHSPVSSLLAVQ